MQNNKKLVELLIQVATIYRFKLTNEILDIYLEVLENLKYEPTREAIMLFLKDPSSSWMPKPAEIIARYKEPPDFKVVWDYNEAGEKISCHKEPI
jgi:hypothetical protein